MLARVLLPGWTVFAWLPNKSLFRQGMGRAAANQSLLLRAHQKEDRMNRTTWILYLIGSALVFGSWLGVINPTVGWIGWLVATGIALLSWSRRPAQPCSGKPRRGATTPQSSPFTAEEEAAARREVHGEE